MSTNYEDMERQNAMKSYAAISSAFNPLCTALLPKGGTE